jgi:hypothetical protein
MHTELKFVRAINSVAPITCTQSSALGPARSSCIVFILQIHARHVELKINACALFYAIKDQMKLHLYLVLQKGNTFVQITGEFLRLSI